MTKLKVMIALVAVMFAGHRAWQASTKVVVASLTSVFASQATLTQSSFRQAGPVPEPKVASNRATPEKTITRRMRVVRSRVPVNSFEQECSCKFDPRQGNVFILTNPEPGAVSLGG